MAQVVIENPILNSPYSEPTRHFRFSDDGITDEIVESRRISQYFMPIASPKKDKAAKIATARTLWVPVVTNHGGLRALGVPEDHRSVGRQEHEPRVPARGKGGRGRAAAAAREVRK